MARPASRRVLLVGGDGKLGSDIRRMIEKSREGWSVRVTGRPELDLAGPLHDQLLRIEPGGFDVVVNCAAYHDVALAEEQPGSAFRVNAYAVRELARFCDERGAHFVHVSTDYVFGSGEDQVPLREADPTGPLNVYGASKLMGESLIGPTRRLTICRVASLFGPGGAAGSRNNFVELMLSRARAGAPISVVDNRFMSPTFTLDAAAAILSLIEAQLYGLFHVVNSGTASWWDFANAILAEAGLGGYPITRRSDDLREDAPPVRPLFSALDNRKCIDATGHAMRDWREALADYLRLRKLRGEGPRA